MRKLFVLLAAAALIPTSLFAWERSIKSRTGQAIDFNKVTSVEVYGMKSNLDGKVNVDGLNVDLDSEANFDDETTIGLKINHVLSDRGRLTFSYLKQDHSGRINKAVTFKNRNYQANASADIEANWFDLTYAHVLTTSEKNDDASHECFYLDGLLGVKFTDLDLSVTGVEPLTNAYVRNSWSESYPVPYLGLAAGGQLGDNFFLKGQIKYINVNAGGADMQHFDYGINAALRLNPNSKDTEWFIDLGYRGVKFDGDSDGDEAEVKYRGPTFGIVARF